MTSPGTRRPATDGPAVAPARDPGRHPGEGSSTAPPPLSTDVLVVGGGPTGLAAGMLAARAGHEVVLAEAGPRLGGMAASLTVAGQRVDLGSHRLHPSAPPRVRALLDELLGDDLQVRPRRGRLHIDGRWARFPLDPVDLLRSIPPTTAARIGGELLLGAVRGSLTTGRDAAGPGHGAAAPTTDSYAEVVRQRLGSTVLRRFHGPYARKLYGVDPATIDGEVARRRIALTGLGDVLQRLRRTRGDGGGTFLYPRRGFGQVVDRLAEEAVAAGAVIHTGARIHRLDAGDDGVSVEWTSTEQHGAGHHAAGQRETGRHEAGRHGRNAPAQRRIVAREVLWTAPPTALASAAGRPAVRLDHRGVALVYLVVDQHRWLPWDAHYVPTPDVPFVRLSEPRNYRDGPDPDGRTVLCAEVPSSVDDATWASDDQQLAAAVRAGIDRLGLPRPTVVDHRVVRLPRVYPLLRVGDSARLADALDGLASLPGVTLLGRQALGVADNLHHVLAMAIAAVDCMDRDGRVDRRSWDRHLAVFAEHVVED